MVAVAAGTVKPRSIRCRALAQLASDPARSISSVLANLVVVPPLITPPPLSSPALSKLPSRLLLLALLSPHESPLSSRVIPATAPAPSCGPALLPASAPAGVRLDESFASAAPVRGQMPSGTASACAEEAYDEMEQEDRRMPGAGPMSRGDVPVTDGILW